MPSPRPLPRSLVPLPGESLPGFLLRLSRRLNQPPARIAELTGLAPDGASRTHIPVILLAGIPETGSSAFTRMTRLTGVQAAQLGMSTWQGRYPPVIASPESKARGARRLDGRLILAPATRYCPECLAGDGSAIQESFGGPWLKAWHLPVVFACPVHQRLLEHLCPGCGQAVRGRRPGRNPALLPAMLAAGLHPAQCRTEIRQGTGRHPACCGARLDQGSDRRPASPGLIALQDKILGLLGQAGPAATLSAGMPAPPASYFSDLRALALLACSTWPAARHLSPDEDAASAVDQHVESLRKQAAARRAGSPGDASRTRLDFSFPPADAAASGGLARIADRILTGNRDDVREQLLLLLPFGTQNAGQSRWGLSMTRMAIPCSEGLQAAYAPVLRTFTRTGGSGGRRDAVLRPGRWGLENIPAFLPQDWYARHFMPIAGVSDRFIRRTAALRLVQMVAGGSLSDAAQLLGIASPAPPCRATASTPEQATSTPGQGNSTAPSASRTRWKPWHARSTTRQRHWPATSPGDRRCRPGTSTRTPGQASPPACPPPPAPSSPTSETGNASSPPSTSGSRSHPVNTSSPRDLSRPSCLPASGNPGPSGQVHGNCWTPATPDLTTPA